MSLKIEQIDELLFAKNSIGEEESKENKDLYLGRYLEQYKLYLDIFNSTINRRQKSSEFFLGLNTAIIGILGYIETREIVHEPMIFVLVPIVGIGICYSWHRIIHIYKQLNRAKFKVIHMMEKKLPIALFETEWELLGKGKDKSKYYPVSQVEKNIPIIFIMLYVVILMTNIPWSSILEFFKW